MEVKHSIVAGIPVNSGQLLQIKSPYDGRTVGTVTMASPVDIERALSVAHAGGPTLSRYQRFAILDKARLLLMVKYLLQIRLKC